MVTHIFSDKAQRPPLYFVTMSSHHNQEKIVRPNGLRDTNQLLFVLDGKGTLIHGGREYPLSRGSSFFLSRGSAHEYFGEGFVTAWITFCGSALADIKDFFECRDMIFRENEDVDSFVLMISNMEREYFSLRREGALSSMMYSMLFSFFEDSDRSGDDGIDRAVVYMEKHFARRLTLDELCRIARMGHSSFCEKFKARVGCSSVEKLTEIRLENARRLLFDNQCLKVYEIAEACGFSDVGYFCKTYKKRFGTTPRG